MFGRLVLFKRKNYRLTHDAIQTDADVIEEFCEPGV